MSQDNNCAIWNTPADIYPTSRDGNYFDSPRAGGKYFIFTKAVVNSKRLDGIERILLTNWLIEQRRLGVQCPEITSETVEKVINSQPLSVHKRADNLLRFLSEKSRLIGDIIQLSYARDMNSENQSLETLNNFPFLAHTSSLQFPEILLLVKYCEEKNWIENLVDTATSPLIGRAYKLTLKAGGYARLAKLETNNTDSNQCFVAMWFHESMEEAYKNGIETAVQNCGFKPKRVDEVQHNDKIDDLIISEIRRSRFVIADFTSEPNKPRGGVYYEAGFAQGLNIPVIWTCRENLIEYVHFDTRQYNHILWNTHEELCEKLTTRIGAVIGDGPLLNRN